MSVEDEWSDSGTAAWLLKADRARADVEATLADHGVVTTLRIPFSRRLEQMSAGQRCLLYVSGRHPDGRGDALIVGSGVIVGVDPVGAEAESEAEEERGRESADGPVPDVDAGAERASGAVDRPAATADRDESGPDAGSEAAARRDEDRPERSGERVVELAVRPLIRPIHRGELLAHAVLAGSELFTERTQPNPLRLTAAEVEALTTTFDLTVETPPRPLIRVIGPSGEPSFSIEADGSGSWSVTRFGGDGETTTEVFPTAIAATASISAEVAAIGERLGSQVPEAGVAEDLEPLVIFDGGAGRELSVFRIAHRYAVFEVHRDGQVDPPLLGALDDLDAGMISLAGHLTGEHSHDHGHGRGHGGHEHGSGTDVDEDGEAGRPSGADDPSRYPGGLRGWRRF